MLPGAGFKSRHAPSPGVKQVSYFLESLTRPVSVYKMLRLPFRNRLCLANRRSRRREERGPVDSVFTLSKTPNTHVACTRTYPHTHTPALAHKHTHTHTQHTHTHPCTLQVASMSFIATFLSFVFLSSLNVRYLFLHGGRPSRASTYGESSSSCKAARTPGCTCPSKAHPQIELTGECRHVHSSA